MSNKIMKERLVKYLETGDEFLFDEKVFKELKKYILYISHRWIGEEYSKEDILEICLCRIGTALKDFDPERGEITTFLASICENAMRKDKHNKSAKKRINYNLVNSLNDIYYKTGNSSKQKTYEEVFLIHYDKEYTGIDYSKYIIQACENIEEKVKVKATNGKKLKYDLKKMFALYYQGYNQTEVGEYCGVSQVQVSRMLKRIRTEIIRLMKEDKVI